ncbi:DUF6131 family protein [Rhodococcus sp. USK13]|nr:DUF6131 family protein [Rhodococcus sp. USK13]
MIILGIIIALIVIGVVMVIMGSMGHAVAGHRPYY